MEKFEFLFSVNTEHSRRLNRGQQIGFGAIVNDPKFFYSPVAVTARSHKNRMYINNLPTTFNCFLISFVN